MLLSRVFANSSWRMVVLTISSVVSIANRTLVIADKQQSGRGSLSLYPQAEDTLPEISLPAVNS